jgi:hypothetical protein
LSDVNGGLNALHANVDRQLRPRDALPVYPTTFAEDARLLAARRQHATLLRHSGRGWIATFT